MAGWFGCVGSRCPCVLISAAAGVASWADQPWHTAAAGALRERWIRWAARSAQGDGCSSSGRCRPTYKGVEIGDRQQGRAGLLAQPAGCVHQAQEALCQGTAPWWGTREARRARHAGMGKACPLPSPTPTRDGLSFAIFHEH